MLVNKLHLLSWNAVLFTEWNHVFEEILGAEDFGLLIVHLIFKVRVERSRTHFFHDAAHPGFKITCFYLIVNYLRDRNQDLTISRL